jgi:hypothetical protein
MSHLIYIYIYIYIYMYVYICFVVSPDPFGSCVSMCSHTFLFAGAF